jgi:hypothetical protein
MGRKLTAEGSVVAAVPVTIDVNTWDFPLEIWTDPGEVEIQEIGGTDVLRVYARFYLGSTRELNDTGRVTYIPTLGDENIFHVLADGTILALATGEGSLTVRVGSMQTVVPVRVIGEGTVTNPPHAQAAVVGSAEICTGFNVCLDATDSYDLDELLGDNLTYSWDLDGDGAFDDLGGSAPCFKVDAADDYVTYQVKVEDSTGGFAYAGGVLTPIYAGCEGVEKVCEIPYTSASAWGVGRDGYLYVIDESYDVIRRYDANCEPAGTIATSTHYSIPSSFEVTPDGSLYYLQWDRDPNGSSSFYYLLGRVAPDGTHTRSILTQYIGLQPSSQIGSNDAGDLYVAVYISGEHHLQKIAVDGSPLMDGVIAAPNGFLNSRRVLGAAGGDIYVLFDDDDSKEIVVKMKEQNGSLVVDTAWADGGFLDLGFSWIPGIAIDGEGRLTASVRPIYSDPNQITHLGTNGEYIGKRTHYTDGTILVPRFAIAAAGDGRIAYEEAGDVLVIAQIYPSGVSAVPDDQDAGSNDPGVTPLRSALSLPNPVVSGGRVEIGYRFPGGSQAVELMIYDLRGALVRTLVREQMLGGDYRVTWDLRDERGRYLPSGIYLARLKTADDIRTGKMVLMK